MEYEAWIGWDPAVHALSSSTTTFPADWLEQITRARRQWWFFPTLNEYIQYTPGEKHAIESAMETVFGAARAEEIIDLCERFGAWKDSLKTLNLDKAKRKAQSAVDAGLITAVEAQNLRDLVAHITA